MIKRYSLQFALAAGFVMFVVSLFTGATYQAIMVRTLVTFFGFYLFGSFLGVITIEALLENQDKKVQEMQGLKAQLAPVKKAEPPPAEEDET